MFCLRMEKVLNRITFCVSEGHMFEEFPKDENIFDRSNLVSSFFVNFKLIYSNF